ncbi:hypothetical protein DAQ1742_02965 [Dickeya aquatica]|uniref:Uncharacterized protein n=1 Tax=Dickeya aquatica TaxID=1401087 RepID=A0A375AD11_9GAMM|nr:hypothetical protein DAQ1742_02965 [Dickeya aquatica]
MQYGRKRWRVLPDEYGVYGVVVAGLFVREWFYEITPEQAAIV